MTSQNNQDDPQEGKKIDAARVLHIAHLARIGISDGEAEKFAGQLNSVLDYMKILEEVRTDDVKMTLQVNGLENVTRSDEVRVEETAASLLSVSPMNKIMGQLAVKAVIKED